MSMFALFTKIKNILQNWRIHLAGQSENNNVITTTTTVKTV